MRQGGEGGRRASETWRTPRLPLVYNRAEPFVGSILPATSEIFIVAAVRESCVQQSESTAVGLSAKAQSFPSSRFGEEDDSVLAHLRLDERERERERDPVRKDGGGAGREASVVIHRVLLFHKLFSHTIPKDRSTCNPSRRRPCIRRATRQPMKRNP